MAPQVTVFFHKLPATGDNAKKTGHRMSFVLSHAPVTRSMTKSKLGAKQDKKAVKVVKTQIVKTPSKNALRNQRKRAARAQKKRDAEAKTIEAILAEIAQLTPSMAETAKVPKTLSATKTHMSAYFMVGTIPVYLPSTENVMVTSTEEKDEDEVSVAQQSTTSSQQVIINPKQIAEDVIKALDAPSKRPGRPKGAKNKEYPVFGDDYYSGPITRNKAHKKAPEDTSSVGTASEDEGQMWKDNPLYETSVIERVSQPRKSQIDGCSQGSESSESKEPDGAQVLVANPQSPEEQMQELQRRLAQLEFEAIRRQEEEAKRCVEIEAAAAKKLEEKEAEVAALVAQLALMANDKGKNKDIAYQASVRVLLYCLENDIGCCCGSQGRLLFMGSRRSQMCMFSQKDL